MKRFALVLAVAWSVTGCGGGGGGSTPAPAVPAPVNLNPAASAGADQTVFEGSMVTLDGSASSDPDGTVTGFLWTQTAGPAVTLTNANMAMASFDAPAVTGTATFSFQVSATDNAGATGTDTVDITVNDVVNQNPAASAGADQSVAEGTSVTLDGSASSDPDGTVTGFQWMQTAGPAVMLADADKAMATFTAPQVAADTTLTFTLTATDDMGGTNSDSVDVVVTNVVATATISGKVTYEHVKHNPATNGLDFNASTQDPVPGATVQALDAANMVLASTKTDAAGDYSLTVAQNTDVRIRVRAEVIQTGPPSWDLRVVDNTSVDNMGNAAAYVLNGSLSTTGTADSTRNLHAASGWNTGTMSYTATRAAAPFAILVSFYEAIQKTAAVDAAVVFPPVLANWSTGNVPSSGDTAAGLIGTSNYDGTSIFVLGAANNDTDEFDGHVIVHEWGHYFEAQLSRSDSIGGAHSGGDELDIRVAFGEGFGNALSGIVTADPIYRDSSGAMEGSGFQINVETNDTNGWFNETTVQSLLYDLFDATPDGLSDTMALGWGPLYTTFASAAYKGVAARTSIFAYLTRLKADNPGMAAAIDALAAASNVNGTDEFGAGETDLPTAPAPLNAGDITPVYVDIATDGAAKRVCSINQYGTSNKLSNRRFLKLDIAAAGTFRIQVTAVTPGPDGDVAIYKDAARVALFETVGNEDSMQALGAGVHVLEVYDACNAFTGVAGCPGGGNARSCFDVVVN